LAAALSWGKNITFSIAYTRQADDPFWEAHLGFCKTAAAEINPFTYPVTDVAYSIVGLLRH
jgi:hypothetical protein